MNGDKFTVHGVTDADRAAVLSARAKGDLGAGAVVKPSAKVNGVLEVKKADYMVVRVRLHYVTKPCDISHMTVWSLLIIL